ncbi:MAG: hypothetical protein IPK68_09840 [Bdellovibrionales bacterium]|nr:hypothetical protein [Bdellovibrionales bacterium]
MMKIFFKGRAFTANPEIELWWARVCAGHAEAAAKYSRSIYSLARVVAAGRVAAWYATMLIADHGLQSDQTMRRLRSRSAQDISMKSMKGSMICLI